MVEQVEWLTPDAGETVVWTGKPRVWRIVSTTTSSDSTTRPPPRNRRSIPK